MLYFHYLSPTNRMQMGNLKWSIDSDMKEEWFNDPLAIKYLWDIDMVEGGKGYFIVNKRFNRPIPPRDLSCGCKTLLYLQFMPQFSYYLHAMGENCFRWMVEISKLHDIHLIYSYYALWPKDVELYAIDADTGNPIRSGHEANSLYWDRSDEMTEAGII